MTAGASGSMGGASSVQYRPGLGLSLSSDRGHGDFSTVVCRGV